jgi:hypothetical protein
MWPSESKARSELNPTPVETVPYEEPFAIDVFDQEEAVVQEEEHHAYLSP